MKGRFDLADGMNHATGSQQKPDQVDVFGTRVSLTTVDEVVDLLLGSNGHRSVVAVANVHTVMSARRDAHLADFLSAADVVTPDGVPLVWALRAAAHPDAVRVTGIDVMMKTFDLGREPGVGHFFYGSTEEVLGLMEQRAAELYPGVRVSGTISPPYRKLTGDELDEHIEAIRASGARIVWVGLGMPKQEKWMAEVAARLPGVSLIGVGAAFDWLAGTVPLAPEWMRRNGLEWLFRLVLNPRRMWRRYYYNNPAFLALLGGRWLRYLPRRLRQRRARGVASG